MNKSSLAGVESAKQIRGKTGGEERKIQEKDSQREPKKGPSPRGKKKSQKDLGVPAGPEGGGCQVK